LSVLKSKKTAAVLTDHRQSPQWLAQWLIEKGVQRAKVAVFERLGSGEEAFDWYPLELAATRDFSEPNLVILKPAPAENETDSLELGMPDGAYLHERGLITKSEVRAVTLAKLRLGPGMTLWDLGAGSGAVGIEASVLLGNGRVVAVEKNTARVGYIQRNARKYNVWNLDVLQAELPDGLRALPEPDRIFIGGGGRDLAAIVQKAARRLKPGGRLVANTVLLDNLAPAVAAMEAAQMVVEVVQLQVNRSQQMPWSRRLEAENPVWIVRGEKS
jgi:precorrin-6Y C5,15-methyltransferase (decarboxylating)